MKLHMSTLRSFIVPGLLVRIRRVSVLAVAPCQRISVWSTRPIFAFIDTKVPEGSLEKLAIIDELALLEFITLPVTSVSYAHLCATKGVKRLETQRGSTYCHKINSKTDSPYDGRGPQHLREN